MEVRGDVIVGYPRGGPKSENSREMLSVLKKVSLPPRDCNAFQAANNLPKDPANGLARLFPAIAT
jgi:hypothetical protein